MPDSHQILKQIFKFDAFKGEQEQVIQDLVKGENVFVMMPTGGGKSLCYQVASIIRPGTGIIISPLIALMRDQVLYLKEHNIKAEYLNSSLSVQEQALVSMKYQKGELDLLYVSPERAVRPAFLQMLQQSLVALFAVDEAHCVSQWGHDFRPEYKELSRLFEHFSSIPIAAFTATAEKQTQVDIVQHLALKNAQIYSASFDRPNIYYQIQERHNIKEQLLEFVETFTLESSGIVYCNSRRQVESICRFLRQHGRTSFAYHAGLSNEERSFAQDYFLAKTGVIIVATIAFGMGIDKKDVRFVAHLSLPKNLESFMQESGRAGRDGEPAIAWMAYGLSDFMLNKKRILQAYSRPQVKQKQCKDLRKMLSFAENEKCRRKNLLSYFEEDYDAPCGYCDNCKQPPQLWKATVSAQKALSCTYRMGQEHDIRQIINVLTGKNTAKTKKFGHQGLSTFGIGKEHSKDKWMSIFRQLVADGYLEFSEQNLNIPRLTEKSRPVLRSEIELKFR